MNETDEDEADTGLPPGDDATGLYRATAFVGGSGRSGGGFFWFSCADHRRDRVLQLAHLREFEPGDLHGPRALLHLSGMDVMLEGTGMRHVAWRIFLGRCTSVHEIRPGQRPAKAGDPVIRRILFLVPPSPEARMQARKPRHEPETERTKT